ncbi:M48 family metallopeptidase [Thermodesulfobacteriota bacterium]
MNLLLMILLLYCAIQVFENIFSYINLRYLARHGAEIPAEFVGHLDEKTLQQMRDYSLAHGKVNFLSSFSDIVITIAFLFCGILNWYNNLLLNLQWPFLATAIPFFLLLTYGETILKLPFSYYNTFHIEQHFGFNTQTIRLWITDIFKSLLLMTLLYGLLLSGTFWIIQTFPDGWWIIVWFFVLAFTIFTMYLSPYVIEPLFNKFTPIEQESLEARIKETMLKAGLSITRVSTMDASKRSTHGNAYFTGIGHVKRIVLFDTLIKNNSEDELVGILAHEAGHWKKKHILKRLIFTEIMAFCGLYVAYLLTRSDRLTDIFGISQPTMQAKLLLVGFLASLILFPLKPLSSYLSRKHEREADDFAAELTKNSTALADALVKLGKDNLANLHPHPWYAAFYYSHPPLTQRIRYLNSLAKPGERAAKG